MSNEIAIVPENIPAHILNSNMAREMNADAGSGISTGFPPSIRLKNGKFRLVDGAGEETVLKAADLKDLQYLDFVVLRSKPGLNKVWYAKAYDPNAEASAPDCYSVDGVKPAADSPSPQCTNCATCPMNAWGSGRNQNNEATKGKACADNKINAVLYKGGVYQFKIPPASLKNWAVFVKNLSSRDVPLGAVIVYAAFDEDSDFSVLTFRVGDFVPEAAFPKLMEYVNSPEVDEIINAAVITAPAVPADAPAKPVADAPAPATEEDIFGGAAVEKEPAKTADPVKTEPVEATTDSSTTEPDWSSMTAKDLKAMAKKLGMKGYSKLSADELSDAVYEAWDEAQGTPAEPVETKPVETKPVETKPAATTAAPSGAPSDADLADVFGL